MRKYIIFALVFATLLISLVANANMPSDVIKNNKLSQPEPMDTQNIDPIVFNNLREPIVVPSEIVSVNRILLPGLLNSMFTSPDAFKDPLFKNPDFLHHVHM